MDIKPLLVLAKLLAKYGLTALVFTTIDDEVWKMWNSGLNVYVRRVRLAPARGQNMWSTNLGEPTNPDTLKAARFLAPMFACKADDLFRYRLEDMALDQRMLRTEQFVV